MHVSSVKDLDICVGQCNPAALLTRGVDSVL